MPIAYPLSMPVPYKVAQVQFDASAAAGANVSPFTFEQQIYVHQGDLLEVTVSCPPMARRNAEKMVAWGLSLNGLEGTFLLPPPGYGAGALGSLAGYAAAVVLGGGQTGRILTTDGWTPFAQGVLVEGDWLQVGTGLTSRLYKNLTPANVDGYSAVSLDIWPRLRESPNDNDPITLKNPVGLFQLADPKFSWSVAQAMIYGIQFKAREAI